MKITGTYLFAQYVEQPPNSALHLTAIPQLRCVLAAGKLGR
ncbi:MAG: hypothetical protein QM379_09745 [Acidobacteriota bacterium]|nr:hypothetical protein [Acidobacteriota bacterium]